MKVVFVLLVAAALLFATNPGPEKHRDALKEELRLQLRTADLPAGELGRAFAGIALETGMVDALIASEFIYEDLLLFSFGNLGDKQGVTIGIMGRVITGGQIERWEKQRAQSASPARETLPAVEPSISNPSAGSQAAIPAVEPPVALPVQGYQELVPATEPPTSLPVRGYQELVPPAEPPSSLPARGFQELVPPTEPPKELPAPPQ